MVSGEDIFADKRQLVMPVSAVCGSVIVPVFQGESRGGHDRSFDFGNPKLNSQ